MIAFQAASDPCPDPAAPAPPASSSNLAVWVLAAALLAVIIFDVWAGRTKTHPTISQWMRRVFGRHRWWRPFAMSLIGLTLWHMFFGGPL
jgi:hypothetical protein